MISVYQNVTYLIRKFINQMPQWQQVLQYAKLPIVVERQRNEGASIGARDIGDGIGRFSRKAERDKLRSLVRRDVGFANPKHGVGLVGVVPASCGIVGDAHL